MDTGLFFYNIFYSTLNSNDHRIGR